ncbi:MAG: carboxyl transferase domain-containing protein, partial [Xanthomonadales bacterium]|nr:carboxyl transferase domain-containing protein [Xanthomonadales bacterium]
MAAYQSTIDPAGETFQSNRADMLELVARLRELEQRAVAKSEKRRPRFEERGQLTPRERLAGLLDPGMPFLELYNLCNYLADDPDPETSIPGGNMIAGIGFVSGVRSMVFVDDSGISAGASTSQSVQKALGILEIARRQKLPLIHLVESAGANLMNYTVELWAHGGGMFYGLARLSAEGIPTFVVLHGPSTAGGAYQPGMSDYVIGVKKNGMAALAGAALVKAATGEVADERELGGSEMHASVSGLVEYLADDDAHGIAIARDLFTRLDWNKNCEPTAVRDFSEPGYDADEIAGVVPVDYRKPYDVREVLARVVDGSDFAEFKPGFGVSTVCAQASIYGHACGILGNNGPIDPDGAAKAGQFVQLCDQADLPLIFLSNTTGYMVGTEYEQAGMIKHGAKMIQAVSNARVPRITLYVGASFGAGNYGMCGYAYEPDFLFAWPNAMTG